MDTGERLQKALARAGYGSRRACELLISARRVTIDGRVAELGNRVDPELREIRVRRMRGIATLAVPTFFGVRRALVGRRACDIRSARRRSERECEQAENGSRRMALHGGTRLSPCRLRRRPDGFESVWKLLVRR